MRIVLNNVGLCLLFVLAVSCLAWPGAAWAGCDKQSFMNRDYRPECARTLPDSGAPAIFMVRDGAFETAPGMGAVYFTVNDVACADLNGDGGEEAVITTTCGFRGANYSLLEAFIYGRAPEYKKRLATLADERVAADYKKFHPKSSPFPLQEVSVENTAGKTMLVATFFADGPHCCPEKKVTMRYLFKQGRLQLEGEPVLEAVEGK